MTATTEGQVEIIKAMCQSMIDAGVVEEAWVNDWGRFGNFDIFIVPLMHDRHTTRKLSALAKQFVPKGAKVRSIYGPDPIREWDRYNRKSRIIGYSRKSWSVDVDFFEYDVDSNHFH